MAGVEQERRVREEEVEEDVGRSGRSGRISVGINIAKTSPKKRCLERERVVRFELLREVGRRGDQMEIARMERKKDLPESHLPKLRSTVNEARDW
jgi:hypothetical protein